jgi:transcriptional regulator with XRE-family HTH domain
MTDVQRPRGRPPFRIDPKRLRQLRLDARLTQIEAAKRIYKRMGDSKTALSVMKTNYQRWERTGAIAPETAKHLADELGQTVAVLQGSTPEASPSALEQIAERLRDLSAAGAPPVRAALEQFAEDENPVRELAKSVAGRLEAAQLSQDRTELTQLAALTGWTVDDLLRPIGDQGHWMLIGSGHLGPRRSEILHGLSDLTYEVRKDLQESLSRIHESDARVSFHEDVPWFRIEVEHPWIPKLTRTLRFVRAQPTEAGLHWTKPTLWDRERLHALPADAYRLANFVSDYSADRSSRFDLSRLRLALVRALSLKETEKHGPEIRPEIIGLAKLGSEEPPPDALTRFQRDGSAHHLFTSLLAPALWDILAPLLHAWPVEYWRFSDAAGRVEVSLDAPLYQVLRRGEEPRFGPLYQIVLLEESPDAKLRNVPWRDSSVTFVRERLQRFLDRVRDEVCVGPPRPLTT